MTNAHRPLLSLCLLAIVFSSAVFANVSAQRMMAPPIATSASQSNQVNFLGLKKTLTSRVEPVIQLAANLTPIPPPQASGIVLSASKVPQSREEATSTPLGTPIVFPNGTILQPSPGTNHWWDILYYSQSASDYGGSFQAQANTISGFATGLSESDQLLILPLNIAIGYSNDLAWFQFEIEFSHSCTLYVCSQGILGWYIWDNVDPTGACSQTSVTYNSYTISSTSSYSNTALAYTPGDSYHWDFYAAASPANTIVFLVVDDSEGGVGAGAYWWYEWQVPSLSLVYNGSCFSPATALEGYTDTSTTSLSNVPSWLFSEGYPSETYGTSDITGPYTESSGISEGEPSGISETMYPIDSSGDWYWLIFESGLTQTLTTNVSSGSSGSVSPNCPSGCSEAVGSSISVTATPSTYWQLSSWTISGASCTGGSSGNPCQFTMPDNAVTLTATFTQISEQITITSSPSGSGFVSVDGSSITTPQIYTWYAGSTHTLTANSPVGCGSGCQYVYLSWSDGGGQSHSITVPSSSATYTADYFTEYYLTMQANPSAGGSVSPSSGWNSAGNTISISETANNGWQFTGWTGTGSGSCSGSCTSVTLNGPITETANFQTEAALSVGLVSPPSPGSGATVASVPITLEVQVTSSGSPVQGASVTIDVDSTAACSGSSASNGYYSCVPPIAYSSGEHTWYATAIKSGYSTGTSSTWSFTTPSVSVGLSDLVVWRASSGTWWVRHPDGSYWVTGWGQPGDVPLVGDVDGNGMADLIIWRPSTGVWWILHSSTGYTTASTYQWGQSGDVPLVGDVDGNGKADLIIWRPSTGVWYILHSSTGYTTASAYGWGQSGDTPLLGDLDGNGKADLIIWRPSNGIWYILHSSTGYTYATATGYQWGESGDAPTVYYPNAV